MHRPIQYSTIMTFSDAEEDQPSVMHGGALTSNSLSASSSNSEDARPNNGASSTSPEGATAEDSSCSTSFGKETSESSPSLSISSSVSSPTPYTGTTPSSITPLVNNSNGNSLATVQNGISDSPISNEPIGLPSQASNSSVMATQSSDEIRDDSVTSVENSAKDLETKKILEKLQQIQGYIQQTANAMQNLENEGDLNKIRHYNTLVKCMRELENSEEKLTTHLNRIKARPVQSVTENGTSGSESMGVIGDLNGEGNRASMSDRLAFHESEQQQLSERLRESLVRRQELMSRYQATRERLNNLKQQRSQYVQEERRLLQSVGVSENPYDDPIPGAETWTIEQLETGIRDFQGLRDKVDNLHSAYTAKLQGLEENDVEGRNEVQRKMEQIMCKRTQIGGALTQMADLIQARRGNEQAEEPLANDTSADGAAAPSNNNPAPPEPGTTPARAPTDGRTPAEGRAPSEGSVVPGIQIESEEQAAGRAAMSADLMAKQQHLQSLKDQLVNMKKLLQVTEEAAAASENILNDPEFNEENDTTENDESQTATNDQHGMSSNELVVDRESGESMLESTVVGVRGKLIHLSEIERRNPVVISKYKQLSEAKERLAKMEEVMNKITEARQSGRPLIEVLTAENLDLLERAKADEDLGDILNEDPVAAAHDVRSENFDTHEVGSASLPGAFNDDSASAEEIQRRTPLPVVSQPKKNLVNRVEDKPSNGGSAEWEREREISAMQFHLKKSNPQIPLVNEGFQVGREKGAIKKQARNLVNESGSDPRLQEVRVLQEELKEKKNALEALMRRMGKSSSFTMDNISDNISENISDSADSTEHPLRRYFSNHNVEEYRREAPPEEFTLGYSAPIRHGSVNQRTPSDKNRNRCNPQNSQRNPDSNQFSVNDLSSFPESVRPKHNRTAAGNIPAASTEGLSNPSVSAPFSQNQSNSKVQNTVASALSQLSQVQETINSLYGELRTAEMSVPRPHELPVPNIYGTNTMVPQPNVPYNVMAQNLMPNYCMSPLPNNAQGRADLGPSNYVLAGLQQCFSQLYLHSLEIQSLSKHLQVIDQRDKSISPPQQRGNQRANSVERRSERQRVNDDNLQQPNSSQSENANFFQMSNADCENRKGKYIPSCSRTGVSNPLYSRLPNTQHRPRSQQLDASDELMDLEFAIKNLLPFDGSASEDVHPNGDLLLDSSTQFPLQGEELNEGLSWTTVSSPPMPHHSTDVLNNQVLPGTRANNYWDNFRSYSRQNPLSTAAKSNTGEHFSLSGSSTPARGQRTLNTSGRLSQQQQAVFENNNRQFNKTFYSHNSINKASDKNSSSSRYQNRGGARARYPHQQVNGMRPTAASNSLHHFNVGRSSPVSVAPPSGGRLEGDGGKRNNRQHPRSAYPEERFPEAMTANQREAINEELFFNENARVNSNSFRRLARDVQDTERLNRTSTEDVSESLMDKNLQQPQFLMHLFHHAARITTDTDQQVALELLRELSQQSHSNNIQNNNWTSISSGIQSDNVFAQPQAPTSARDSREGIYRNNTRFSSKNSHTARGISGSDASESGMTSDEDDRKVFRLFSPRTCSDHSNNPSSVGASPSHNSLLQNRQYKCDSRNDLRRGVFNDVSPAANADGGRLENSRLQRKQEEIKFRNCIAAHSSSANSFAAPLPKSNSNAAPSLFNHQRDAPLGDVYNSRRHMRKSSKRNLTKSAEERSNFSSKSPPHKLFDPKNQASAANAAAGEVSGFGAVVSAALKEVLLCYETADYSLSSTSRILQNLHHSIMNQVEIHSLALQFSSSFVSSIDSQLKATLRGFYTRNFSSVRQELAAAVTQVLMQEYCLHQYTHLDNISVEGKSGQMQDSMTKKNDPEKPKLTLTPQLNKHSREHSLFSSHDPSARQISRPSNTSWPYTGNMAMEAESVQGNRDFGKEFRCESNKGKDGAISKHGGAANITLGLGVSEEDAHSGNQAGVLSSAVSNSSVPPSCVSTSSVPSSVGLPFGLGTQETANSLSRKSPLPEASSFPESWVMHRAAQNTSDVELLNVSDAGAKVERNDTEADQDHEGARSAEFLNLSLPVHDLAEADQSQDAVEADCVDSSIENDLYENAAPVYAQPLTEPEELTLRFHTRRIEIPEQSLDEVPTRLMSAAEGGMAPFLLNGRVSTEEINGAMSPPHGYTPFSAQAPPAQAIAPPQNGEMVASSVTMTDSQMGKEG